MFQKDRHARPLRTLFGCCGSEAESTEIDNLNLSKQPNLFDYVQHPIAAVGKDPLLMCIPIGSAIHIVAHEPFRSKTQRLNMPSWPGADDSARA